jgi:hypothetical protein
MPLKQKIRNPTVPPGTLRCRFVVSMSQNEFSPEFLPNFHRTSIGNTPHFSDISIGNTCQICDNHSNMYVICYIIHIRYTPDMKFHPQITRKSVNARSEKNDCLLSITVWSHSDRNKCHEMGV